MNTLSLRDLLRLLPLAVISAVAGCGGGADGSSGNTHVRLLNLSSGYVSLDLYANNGDDDTDQNLFSAVARGTLSAYSTFKSDTYTLKFRKSGTTGDLYSMAADLAGGSYTTLIATGATNRFTVGAINEDTDAPSTGYTKLNVINVTATTSIDVYLTGANDSLDDVTPTVASIGDGSQSGPVTVNSGTYRLRITASGSRTDVRLNVPSITMPSAGVVSLIVTPTDGGVLLNAILLPKQGQPTVYNNASSGQLRVLNVSTGYSPLDVYTTGSSSTDTEVQQFASVARGVATVYKSLESDTYALKFRRSGAAGDLLSVSATLPENKSITYVAHGPSSRFAVTQIDDDIAEADSGYTRIQVLNTTAVDSFDLYLTNTSDSLNDVSPTISGIVAATLTNWNIVRKGTYRLRLASSGSKTDVRLDAPAVTLEDKGVLTIILTETAGGVLASAVLLPQQAQPVTLDNGNVRIRGAVGLPTGSLASISVAGTQIVARRSARSFIGDSYTLMPAGTASVEVHVDDALVATGTVTLQPGGDYTLLVWSAGGTPRTSLIPDANLASATHLTKLRLLNGASGLAVPLSLAVDYSPVAEYIGVGAASDVAELSHDTAVRLDVIDSNTLATVLTREDVTLQPDGVYTLFIAGGGTSAVSGTIRKDR
jgi:hypothetical protein